MIGIAPAIRPFSTQKQKRPLDGDLRVNSRAVLVFTSCTLRFGPSSGIMSYTITNLFFFFNPSFLTYLPLSSKYLGWRLAVGRHDMIPCILRLFTPPHIRRYRFPLISLPIPLSIPLHISYAFSPISFLFRGYQMVKPRKSHSYSYPRILEMAQIDSLLNLEFWSKLNNLSLEVSPTPSYLYDLYMFQPGDYS